MRITLESLKSSPSQIKEVQRVLEEAPQYAMKATGHLPGAEEGASLFVALPPGMTIDYKLVYGIRLGR